MGAFAFLWGVLLFGLPMAFLSFPITWISGALVEPDTWGGLVDSLAHVTVLECLVRLLLWSVVSYGYGLYVWRAEEQEERRREEILREMTAGAYRMGRIALDR